VWGDLVMLSHVIPGDGSVILKLISRNYVVEIGEVASQELRRKG
jgi:hypothetical protein